MRVGKLILSVYVFHEVALLDMYLKNDDSSYSLKLNVVAKVSIEQN